MRYKTIIWDLDGTLLDSLEDLKDSTNYALSKFGFAQRTSEEIKKSLGKGVGHLVASSLPCGDKNPHFNEVLEVFKTHYLENSANKTRPYPHIINTLEALKANGVKMAVVSNKFDGAVKEISRKYFGDIFELQIGETKNMRRKPAPDMPLYAMQKLGAKKEETLFIGDSEVDLKTAQNTGIKCLSALWGFKTKEELLENGAQNFAERTEDLSRLLLEV